MRLYFTVAIIKCFEPTAAVTSMMYLLSFIMFNLDQ